MQSYTLFNKFFLNIFIVTKLHLPLFIAPVHSFIHSVDSALFMCMYMRISRMHIRILRYAIVVSHKLLAVQFSPFLPSMHISREESNAPHSDSRCISAILYIYTPRSHACMHACMRRA